MVDFPLTSVQDLDGYAKATHRVGGGDGQLPEGQQRLEEELPKEARKFSLLMLYSAFDLKEDIAQMLKTQMNGKEREQSKVQIK